MAMAHPMAIAIDLFLCNHFAQHVTTDLTPGSNGRGEEEKNRICEQSSQILFFFNLHLESY